MYYLDLHQLYRPTTKNERRAVRKLLNRDKMMEKMLKQQKGACFFCSVQIDMSAHLDHLIPVYYGGDNRYRNLVAACRECNLIKKTDQIEITNKYTIRQYQSYIKAYERVNGRVFDYKVKRWQLYKLYRADLFKEA